MEGLRDEIHADAREATARQIYRAIVKEGRPDIIIAKILLALDDWYAKGLKHGNTRTPGALPDEMGGLKECPFCGSNAEEGNGYVPLESITYAYCSNTECELHFPLMTKKEWNTRATDPLMEEMASYIKMIINLYDFKENDLWMEDGGKLLKKYRERANDNMPGM